MESVDQISLQEYTQAIRDYYSNTQHQKWQRLGQWLINSFNLNMSKDDSSAIFYETDDNKAMEMFVGYIKTPENNS